MIGRTLGRFVILSRLGSGAIGVVYRALDTSTGSDAAVKVLLTEQPTAHNAARRLQREAAFTARIDHPNVVQILDVGSEIDATYVAMELINGASLEQLIAMHGALQPARAARIASDIAAGLAEAHANNVVHRDLKPANVMIEVGRPERAKLVDFGVARLFDTEETDKLTPLTREGFTVGTPSYMAPEQFNSGDVGPEADLYALGLLLYEMLAGAPAFAGTLREVVLKQMTASTPPLPSYEGLEEWVTRLTEKLPEERPKTAAEVRDALRALANVLDVIPRAPISQRRITPSSAAAVSPLAEDVLIPLDLDGASLLTSSALEIEPSRRRQRWPWIAIAAAAPIALGAWVFARSAPVYEAAVLAPAPPPPVEMPLQVTSAVAAPAATRPATLVEPAAVRPRPRASYEVVVQALDEVSAALKKRDPAQRQPRLWDRYAELWEDNRRDAPPERQARLLAEIRQLGRDVAKISH